MKVPAWLGSPVLIEGRNHLRDPHGVSLYLDPCGLVDRISGLRHRQDFMGQAYEPISVLAGQLLKNPVRVRAIL